MKPYFHKVQYYETDKMGITHHSNYIRWMEEARTDFLDQIGWSYDRMESIGICSPVLSVSCRYCNPTTYGDTVEIEASVKEYRGVQLQVSYVMKKADGTTVCEAESTHCFLDGKGHFVRMKRDFPELHEVLTALAGQEEKQTGPTASDL